MSHYIIGGLFVALALTVMFQVYHFIQYQRKKDNMLVRGYVSESHLSKGIALTFIEMSLIVLIAVFYMILY